MTPEGRVKAAIKKVLDRYKPDLYAHWPVQNGMGAPTLDCNAEVRGIAFHIEAKAPGEKPTERQQKTIREIERAGGKVFVIDGQQSQLDELDCWINQICTGGPDEA